MGCFSPNTGYFMVFIFIGGSTHRKNWRGLVYASWPHVSSGLDSAPQSEPAGLEPSGLWLQDTDY